jgi:proteasome component ECM29
MLNYISFHVESMNVSRDEYDTIRASVASTTLGPVHDALQIVARRVFVVGTDATSRALVDELMPMLAQLIRRSVGVPTKLGVARLVTTLAVTHKAFFADAKPCGRLLAA